MAGWIGCLKMEKFNDVYINIFYEYGLVLFYDETKFFYKNHGFSVIFEI